LHQQKASSFKVGAPELAQLLTYPRYSEEEHSSRVAELLSLGVTEILLGGRTQVANVNVAGKGQVGIVVKARFGDRICALKVRRTDANRETMDAEVRLHGIANGAGVGAKLYGHSANFIAMEFAKGANIVQWAQEATKKQAQEATASILEQCYRLDRAGVDHGELSRVDRHVIIDESRPTIIDFESASTERKMSNVSAAGQALFVSGPVATMRNKLVPVDRDVAVAALKKYKWDQTRANMDELLALAGS
jgi:putative serine/threonine protein kinase